jgi:hypothetical protein
MGDSSLLGSDDVVAFVDAAGLCSLCQKGSRAVGPLQHTPPGDGRSVCDHDGLLARDTIPGELLEHLGGAMRFSEGGQAAS